MCTFSQEALKLGLSQKHLENSGDNGDRIEIYVSGFVITHMISVLLCINIHESGPGKPSLPTPYAYQHRFVFAFSYVLVQVSTSSNY